MTQWQLTANRQAEVRLRPDPHPQSAAGHGPHQSQLPVPAPKTKKSLPQLALVCTFIFPNIGEVAVGVSQPSATPLILPVVKETTTDEVAEAWLKAADPP